MNIYLVYVNYASIAAMSIPSDLRTRKRLATRQGISDAATRLFLERGFDQVTVDEIAAAAEVGRMTVFNHFPRKEDMLFDRDQELRDMLRRSLLERDAAVNPVETLRRLAHRLVAEDSPSLRFSHDSERFAATVEGSATLQARARAIRDEIADTIAQTLALAAGRAPHDPDARLAAGLLLATWSAALIEAHGVYRAGHDARAAQAAFLALVDRGSRGIAAAMAGTPYA